MPLAVILIAAIFIVSGFRGSSGSLLHQLESDMAQLIVPFVAILIVGAIGYIPGFKKISDLFLALILVAMFLSNGKNGLFSKFQNAIHATSQQGNVSLGKPSFSTNLQDLRLQPLPLLTDAGSLAAG